MYKAPTKIVCTKCGSENVHIVPREMPEPPAVMTLDEMMDRQSMAQPAIYYLTTWKCDACGYSISR